MVDAEMGSEGSELLLVVPLAAPPLGVDEPDPFAGVDTDLELPPAFFSTLCRRRVPGEFVVVLAGRDVGVGGVAAVAVGSGDLESWFAVVAIDPQSTRVGDWLDCARLLSKVEVVLDVCSEAGVEPFDAATRGTVLVSMLLEEALSVSAVADQLGTRAPAHELVVRLDGSSSSPESVSRGAPPVDVHVSK